MPPAAGFGPAALVEKGGDELFDVLGLALAEEVFLATSFAFTHEFFLSVRGVAADEFGALGGGEIIPQPPESFEAVG